MAVASLVAPHWKFVGTVTEPQKKEQKRTWHRTEEFILLIKNALQKSSFIFNNEKGHKKRERKLLLVLICFFRLVLVKISSWAMSVSMLKFFRLPGCPVVLNPINLRSTDWISWLTGFQLFSSRATFSRRKFKSILSSIFQQE